MGLKSSRHCLKFALVQGVSSFEPSNVPAPKRHFALSSRERGQCFVLGLHGSVPLNHSKGEGAIKLHTYGEKIVFL